MKTKFKGERNSNTVQERKRSKSMHVPSHKTLEITSANCDKREVKAMCWALDGGVHSHSRHNGVMEVGDSSQIEVAREQSDRWIFVVMEKYPTANDTDFAVSSSSLVELNERNLDVC